MANARIKQGDEYSVLCSIKLNGAALDMYWVEKIEFMIGGVRKLWPGDVDSDPVNRVFYIPITQKESFSFPADGIVEADVRVKFYGDSVMGAKKKLYVRVSDAISEEVI